MKKNQQPESADLESRVAYLSEVSLFVDLKSNPLAMKEYASIMKERVYLQGATIIEEGMESSEMFILTAGKASVFKNTPEGDRFKVAILDGAQHAFFGEGGMIDSDVRSATIISDSECHCLVFARRDFQSLAERHPEWALPFYSRITATVLARLRKANSDLLLLYKALVAEIRGH